MPGLQRKHMMQSIVHTMQVAPQLGEVIQNLLDLLTPYLWPARIHEFQSDQQMYLCILRVCLVAGGIGHIFAFASKRHPNCVLLNL